MNPKITCLKQRSCNDVVSVQTCLNLRLTLYPCMLYCTKLEQQVLKTQNLGCRCLGTLDHNIRINCFKLSSFREIALGIYELAGKYVVKDIAEMLEVMYDNAMESGWWHNTYADQSKEAYLVSIFFTVNVVQS